MQKKQVPIAEGLFTWPSDDPRLLGSRCCICGKVAFPAQKSCAACSTADTEIIEMPKRGTLWSWTVQAFVPKSPPYQFEETPETFVPFGVGYIELPGNVRVESRLTERDPNKLKIGMTMELVIRKFMEDEEGNDVMIFEFEPVNEAA